VEKLRSHITRWITLVTVITGMALYLVRPVESQYSRNSFARWIESLQSNQDLSNDLKIELQELRAFEGDFQLMVQEASRLIEEYDEQFKLPFPLDAAPSDALPKQLITEWNFYYQLGDLLDGIPPESLKSAKHFFPFGDAPHSQPALHNSIAQFDPYPNFRNYQTGSGLEPMIHGIAIGAP
jgi:hypothetical protein